MAAKIVGIVGPHRDADVQLLKSKVEDRGAEARIVDLELLPATATASVSSVGIVFDGMNLLDFDAFYLRRVSSIWFLPRKEYTQDEWAAEYGRFNDSMANDRALLSFKIALTRILCDRKLVVNPYQAWGFHHLKLHMFWVLKEHGLPVPPFAGGNNYFELARFLETREAVHKPAVTGIVAKVDRASLDAERESLRSRPLVYQEFVRGTSVRAFVLGEEVIAAFALPHTVGGVDASEHIEDMRPIELPEKLRAEIVRAAKAFHMIFSGVDLQYDEQRGRWWFLECNSAPYFRPYVTQGGADIGGRLAEYLLEHSST